MSARTRPLRVLLISNGFAIEYPLGGIERFVISLARALDRACVEPIVCGLWHWGTEYDARWLAALRDEGIDAFTAAPKDDASPLRNYRQLLDGIRAHLTAPVDLIHSHSEFGDPAAIWLKHDLGASAILRTAHNEREWSKRPLRRLLLTNLLLPVCMEREFGVSQTVVDKLNARSMARILGKRAEVLHNVVDFGRFPAQPDRSVAHARLTAELGIPSHAPLIGSVGRLAPQKGYDILLDAMPSLLQRRPDIHLLLIGDGSERAKLETQRDALGLDGAVHFLGARSDIERLLPALDLFVSSSRWEGLPTVILEAMASQTPVLGTRVSGTVELIENGVTGRLVAPGDPAALAGAVDALLADAPLRQRLGEAGNRFARANFAIEPIARRHEEIYEALART